MSVFTLFYGYLLYKVIYEMSSDTDLAGRAGIRTAGREDTEFYLYGRFGNTYILIIVRGDDVDLAGEGLMPTPEEKGEFKEIGSSLY